MTTTRTTVADEAHFLAHVRARSAFHAADAQDFNQGNPECIRDDASTGILEAAAEVPELSTLVAAVKAVRLATATGSHRIDPNEDDATVPNFHNLINSEYVARAPKSSSSSSSASSSSSSSSSSSLSSASSKATAYPLDDEDTARFEGDEDIQNMRKELGLKAEAEMDEDDDVMEGEEDESLENLTRKMTCVITQQVMEMPMVSKLCNHTFEKAGILNMINKSPAKACKCPIGGCNFFHNVTLQTLASPRRT